MYIEAVNSSIDDYKFLIESYRKENKHLRELQRNMDKQYQELEERLDNASKNYTKYIQERDNNWNELKEWLLCMEEVSHLDIKCLQSVLSKMQEIESGKND